MNNYKRLCHCVCSTGSGRERSCEEQAKEAERHKDSTAMKALLVESNAARSRSELNTEERNSCQEKEIKKIEERIKKMDC